MSSQFRVNTELVSKNWALGNKADKFGNSRRWRIGLPAFRAVGKRDGNTQKIADAIYQANNQERPLLDEQESPTDIVERLARAYKYFIKLCEVDFSKARKARRQYGYSRFAVLWDLWLSYEFSIAERGFEYLELNMGNTAMSLFVEDVEDEVPEWKRRSTSVYANAAKLFTDTNVPENLRKAAKNFIDEYDLTFPKVVKDLKRKPL